MRRLIGRLVVLSVVVSTGLLLAFSEELPVPRPVPKAVPAAESQPPRVVLKNAINPDGVGVQRRTRPST